MQCTPWDRRHSLPRPQQLQAGHSDVPLPRSRSRGTVPQLFREPGSRGVGVNVERSLGLGRAWLWPPMSSVPAPLVSALRPSVRSGMAWTDPPPPGSRPGCRPALHAFPLRSAISVVACRGPVSLLFRRCDMRCSWILAGQPPRRCILAAHPCGGGRLGRSRSRRPSTWAPSCGRRPRTWGGRPRSIEGADGERHLCPSLA